VSEVLKGHRHRGSREVALLKYKSCA
jgi:hypothetical protein